MLGVKRPRDNEKANDNNHDTIAGRLIRKTRGLEDPVEISLFIVSICITVALGIIVSWFFIKKRREKKKIYNTDSMSEAEEKKYPEITVIKSKIIESEDHSSHTKDDSASDISSIWDSGKGKHSFIASLDLEIIFLYLIQFYLLHSFLLIKNPNNLTKLFWRKRIGKLGK